MNDAGMSPFDVARTYRLSFAKALSGSLDGRPCVSGRLAEVGYDARSPRRSAPALPGGDTILGGTQPDPEGR